MIFSFVYFFANFASSEPHHGQRLGMISRLALTETHGRTLIDEHSKSIWGVGV